MKEWFSKICDNVRAKDKNVLGKWGFLLGAGVMTLVAGLFDQKLKDKKFEMTLEEEVKKVAARYKDEHKAA